MHFGKSKVIWFICFSFDSISFCSVYTSFKKYNSSKNVSFYSIYTASHIQNCITVPCVRIHNFWGHIIQNLRCQSTRCRETTWLKIYGILLNSTEAYSKMRLLKWKAHLWLRCCPCDDYQILWLSVKDNTIVSLGPADYLKCIVYL